MPKSKQPTNKGQARKQRMRDIGIILYYLDTIQRRIQKQHLSSTQSSMLKIGDEYHDLTVVQIQVLKSVMAHQPVTTKRLAALRDITSSAATQAVDILVKKGMVQRQQDEQDRRSYLISLSPSYQERVTKFMANLGTSFNSIFDVLSDQELTDFAHLSGKIAEENEDG